MSGSVESCTVKGRYFAVAADADGQRDLGGYSNEYRPNGDGSTRKVQTRKKWMLGGLTLVVDDDRADQEFLQEIADGKADVPMTFTMAGGSPTYAGVGGIEGDLQYSTQNGTAQVNFAGPRKLERQ